jgi:hypothetical protein
LSHDIAFLAIQLTDVYFTGKSTQGQDGNMTVSPGSTLANVLVNQNVGAGLVFVRQDWM